MRYARTTKGDLPGGASLDDVQALCDGIATLYGLGDAGKSEASGA